MHGVRVRVRVRGVRLTSSRSTRASHIEISEATVLWEGEREVRENGLSLGGLGSGSA